MGCKREARLSNLSKCVLFVSSSFARTHHGALHQYTTVFEQSLADLFLLAHADVHVGSFFSNFRRVAMQLSGAPVGPYYSTDARWCAYTMCRCGWKGTRSLKAARAKHAVWWKSAEAAADMSASECAAPSPFCPFVRYMQQAGHSQRKWDELCDQMPRFY